MYLSLSKLCGFPLFPCLGSDRTLIHHIISTFLRFYQDLDPKSKMERAISCYFFIMYNLISYNIVISYNTNYKCTYTVYRHGQHPLCIQSYRSISMARLDHLGMCTSKCGPKKSSEFRGSTGMQTQLFTSLAKAERNEIR